MEISKIKEELRKANFCRYLSVQDGKIFVDGTEFKKDCFQVLMLRRMLYEALKEEPTNDEIFTALVEILTEMGEIINQEQEEEEEEEYEIGQTLYTQAELNKRKIEILSDKELKGLQKLIKQEHENFIAKEDWRKFIRWKNEIKQFAVYVKTEREPLYGIVKVKIYFNTLGSICHVQENLDAIFKHHPYLANFRYDSFSQTKEFNNEEYNEDKTPATINNYFKRTFDEWCPRVDIKESIQEALNNNEYNPVIEHFESLTWDGEERLPTFLQKYYNAPNTELNLVYFERWMIALIKRVYIPGCKFDNMLILHGEQGKMKSSLFEWLGNLNGKRYCNHLPQNLKDPQGLVYATKGSFIMMNDDFDDICDKGNIGMIKEFITKQNDFAALKYLHGANFPRHYVLCATTNSSTFLSDDKTFDERRFWIVSVYPEDNEFKLTDELRDQLYAEAVYKYKSNPDIKLWIHEPELVEEEKQLQKMYKNAAADPLADKIISIFKRKYILDEMGEFKDEDDFRKQLNSNIDDAVPVDINLFEDKTKMISKIPSSWVIRAISGLGQRSTDRIIQVLYNAGFHVRKHERDRYKDIQLTTINVNWSLYHEK